MKIVSNVYDAIKENSGLIIRGDIVKNRYGIEHNKVFVCLDDEDIKSLKLCDDLQSVRLI